MPCNRTGLRHRRGGPGDVRDVPRSHPQAGDPVLTTLRAASLCLHSKIVTLRAACLFLMQCKAGYKTHVRLESGDESYSRRAGASPSGSALQNHRSALRTLYPRTSMDWHGSSNSDRPALYKTHVRRGSRDVLRRPVNRQETIRQMYFALLFLRYSCRRIRRCRGDSRDAFPPVCRAV